MLPGTDITVQYCGWRLLLIGARSLPFLATNTRRYSGAAGFAQCLSHPSRHLSFWDLFIETSFTMDTGRSSVYSYTLPYRSVPPPMPAASDIGEDDDSDIFIAIGIDFGTT
jgi:hypothetical protein